MTCLKHEALYTSFALRLNTGKSRQGLARTSPVTFGNVLDEGCGPSGDSTHEGPWASCQPFVWKPEEVRDPISNASH